MNDHAYTVALAPFLAQERQMRTDGGEVIDAHTHLGLDEDGRALGLEELLAQLDQAGARRACVFPLHDPDRRPGYRVPNERVLRWCERSGGRLTPFCRLDPAEEPLREGMRALQAGARGIKLHPRAQGFSFQGPEIDGIFALAEQAKVPILIHAGRGLPPIADGLADIALRYPTVVLILAHGAICDQGILTTRLANHPGVLYDTSCFFTIDLLELFSRVPPERIVFASDPPYGRPATALYMALRIARCSGLDDEMTRMVLGETMAGLLDGRGLPPASAPKRGPTITLSGRLARVYNYLCMAGPALFSGTSEMALAMIEMARAGCRDPDPGEDGEALETIGVALETAARMLSEDERERSRKPDTGPHAPSLLRSQAVDLLFRCMVLSATESDDHTAG